MKVLLLFLLSLQGSSGQNFVVPYQGRFQWFHDRDCTSSSQPVIQALCRGQIKVNNVSDASIICSSIDLTTDLLDELSQSALSGSSFATGIECVNTCDLNPPCEQVYDEVGNYPLSRGTFGEIVFQCEGDTIEDVEGAFVFAEAQGTCRGVFLSDTNYFHAAQLGVVCGIDDIRYDDYYTACATGNARYDELVKIISDPELSFGIPFGQELPYACVSGQDCGGNACLVDAPTLIMQTKLANLVQSSPDCIQTMSLVTEMDPPSAPSVPKGTYTTRFQAQWELVKHNSWSNGELEGSTLVVSCLEGVITFVEATHDTIICTERDELSLECEETDVTTRGPIDTIALREVTYTCTSRDAIPQTRVEYLEANVKRSASRPGSALLWRVMFLGAYCGSFTGGGEYKYNDKVGECGFGTNWGVSPGSSDYGPDVYYCYSTLEIANEGTETVVAPLPSVVVSTDSYTWFEYASSMNCFDFEAAPTISPAPSTSEPTTSPTTLPTTVQRTSQPTGQPSAGESTSAPTPSPSMPPTISTTTEPTMSPLTPTTGEPTVAKTEEPTIAMSEGPTVAPIATQSPTNPMNSVSAARMETMLAFSLVLPMLLLDRLLN